VANFEAAANLLLAEWQLYQTQVLRLEGFMAVGKTGLAKVVANRTGARRIQTDEFAFRPQPPKRRQYEDAIDLVQLRGEAASALSTSDRVIFEGVCLEALLPSSQFGRGLRAYLKRVSVPVLDQSLWYDGLELEARPFTRRWLQRSILVYHRDYRPHELSDICIAIPEPRE
jgi:hypothetical protein